jgi:dTDP-4-amino-4,6-dideoxygalactose transaminase
MRTEYLPFHLPQIGAAEEEAVLRTLRSGWLTTGSEAHAFEREFAENIGVRHAIALNSCTAALHLALEAAGVGPGDEVIVPTMTFAASAEVVAYLNARPVLVDCEPDTLNMSPDAAERAISGRTRAIIPVHFAGHPCDMDAIGALARRHGLAVIEDAAHALPASYHGRTIGTIGQATCFSFYATKTLTTGEGGMVTTDDERLAERIRLMSLHGISRDAWKRYTAEGSWFYEILRPGYKYNLTDIAASIGRAQLARCHEFWHARRRIAQRYDDAFAGTPEIRRPASRADVQHAWHLYVIQLEEGCLSLDRSAFMEALKAERIGASVHFIPLHLHPYYRATFGYQASDFPVASAAYARSVSLPIYSRMSDGDVDDVIDAVKRIVSAHRRAHPVAVPAAVHV